MQANRWFCLILMTILLAAGCGRRPSHRRAPGLTDAAWDGNLAEVQALIARGANVNDGALHAAAVCGHKEVVGVLVRCGARVDSVDSRGRTPAVAAMQENHRAVVEYLVGEGAAVNLHLATYLGDTAKAKSLIDGGADVNARDTDGWTPLHYAVSCDHGEVAHLLIAAGADLSAMANGRDFSRDGACGTALHFAVRHGHLDLVEMLVDSGADPEAEDKYGVTPLNWAVRKGRLEMVKLLIAKGANPNARSKENYFCGGTPLGIAIEEGHVAVADALISGGADVNARDESGWTPLHVAVTSYYWSAVEAAMPEEGPDTSETQADWDRYNAMRESIYADLVMRMLHVLVAHDAEVNAKDEEGVTPLHCAAYHGLRDAVGLLIAQGADVNARTTRDPNPDHIIWENRDFGYGLSPGVTPLHEGAVRGDPCVVEVLLAHGAKLDAVDESGATALHYAAAMASTDVVALLLARGADVNAKDVTGATPLLDALLRGHVKTAKALIAAGAGKVDVAKDSARDHIPGVYMHVQRPLLHEALHRSPWAWRATLREEAGDPNEQDLRREWVALLLANGADLNERDDKGNTPLHAAILGGNEELARLFIARGTDVSTRNQSNITALHYAANDGRGELATLLLAKGADANARDNDGDTPLHNAALRGHKQVVEVLVAHGADTNAKNSRNRTPLEEAARRGHKEVVRLLTAQAQGTSTSAQDGPVERR